MTPHEFIAKWRAVALKERSAAQSHFNDLCALLGLDDPTSADPTGDWFTFERGASKTTGGEGWADVWRKERFAWEYKGRHANLDAALKQLLNYQHALDNPPLLIVSDMDVIRVHTNWTNSVHETHTITLDDLLDAGKRDLLSACFTDPDRLKPAKTRQMLTEEAAQNFVAIAQRLRARGHDAHDVAHFVNRLVFCMFAEDVGLLPDKLFEKMIRASRREPDTFADNAALLFRAMQSGGKVGYDPVAWFNGGLFDSDHTLPLTWEDMDDLIRATALDWSAIDPSIMGTLFERGLDPGKRSQLGAHYTDRDKIMMIVTPVIIEPLLAEWSDVRGRMQALLDAAPAQVPGRLFTPVERGQRTRALNEATALRDGFLDLLTAFRVLDPACGSGNFLYLALKSLKDIALRVAQEAEAMGLARRLEPPGCGPENMLGIELNPYAAELARVSVWIGDIQWSRTNGFEPARNPVLRPLQTIECRDAVLNPDGTRAEWPKADVVIGNPPFLGTKRLRSEMGDANVDALFAAYDGRVERQSDLVCYWFALAWDAIRDGRLARAGLVSTNSIRGGSNREVLKPIVAGGRIFEAWSDEEWTVEGAAVRVSLVCFDAPKGGAVRLDGLEVAEVHPDLTARGIGGAGMDLTRAAPLRENRSVAFMGDTKGGAFDIPGDVAREWLRLPLNPNGRPNSDVLRPWVNGRDLTRQPSGRWIIDFGWAMTEGEAALYEAPFRHCLLMVKPERDRNRRDTYRLNWWRHVEARQGMWASVGSKARWIATPEVSKHRVFAWLDTRICPDHKLQVISRDDDTLFGILLSRLHHIWSLAVGSWHGDGDDGGRPRYTTSTCFMTFPFPEGLTPDIPASAYADDPRAVAIAAAAARLNELREAWLNPPDLARRVPEVVAGYPDRLLPVSDAAAAELKKRTLTNLYNARPAWLDDAHRALDRTVATAYGWPEDPVDLTDDEVLARLFRLNQARAAPGGTH